MSISAGAFDSYGIPQGHHPSLDDLTDVDTAEAKEGETIVRKEGRWVPGVATGAGGEATGNEVVIDAIEPEDLSVELWVDPTRDITTVMDQYLLPVEVLPGSNITVDTTTTPGSVIISATPGGAGTTDHGALTGLGDDDHPQYLNNARGDARYAQASRKVDTNAPLTGGGTLDIDRTLAINNFAGTAPGAVPTSTGGTQNFLRADGAWATPPGTATGVTDHGALTGLTDDDHPQYVKKAGDTVTGPLRVDGQIDAGSNMVIDPSLVGGAGGGNLFLKGPAGQTRAVRVMSSGDNKYRWIYGAEATAETGANAGSDFYIYAYDDTGAAIGHAFYIFRATRKARFYAQPDIYPTSLAEAACSYASGWERYGTSWTDFAAIRWGNIVSIQGMIGRSSSLTVASGSVYPMGTIPSGFRPDTKLRTAAFAYYGTAGRCACWIDIAADGGVDFGCITAGTFTAGSHYVSFSASYRAA